MSAEAAVDLARIGGRPRRHFLAIEQESPDDLRELIELAMRLKRERVRGGAERPLAGRVLAMIFEHPSLRTRVSFEVAMLHLGGTALYIGPDEVGLGKRESVADVARVLSRYVDAIMIRASSHDKVEELARYATVPVINGLSPTEHPCQALADLLTIREHRGALAGVRLAYVGDGNNVCASLMLGGAKLGLRVVVAAPNGYQPAAEVVERAREAAARAGGEVRVTSDPREAVAGADVVYTDVWTSMGQERESAERRAAFAGFQINKQLVDRAGDAVVMHCLPAHRGEEITDEVIESEDSIVFDQAENRLHAQKAILHQLLA
jgi:ornithine carbamoyltransferase